MKAVGIIGFHHSGKTTMAETLIRGLTEMGLQVASIKDIHNEAYKADQPGTNSWRHSLAGAGQVLALGKNDAALIITPPPQWPQLLALFDADWLVIEGLREAAVPKILCADDPAQADELLDDTVFALSGRIAASHSSYAGRPVLKAEPDNPAWLNLVLQKCFEILPQSDPECCSACGKTCHTLAGDIVQGRAQRQDCVLDQQNSIRVLVGGKPLVLVPFVQKLLQDTVLAFMSNLKNVDPTQPIHIEIKS